jgi:hypothetical protein
MTSMPVAPSGPALDAPDRAKALVAGAAPEAEVGGDPGAVAVAVFTTEGSNLVAPKKYSTGDRLISTVTRARNSSAWPAHVVVELCHQVDCYQPGEGK